MATGFLKRLLGQKTMASSQPVVIASDQSAITVKESATTSTVSEVSATDVETLLAAANALSRQLLIVNRSNRKLFIKTGTGILYDGPIRSFSDSVEPGKTFASPLYQGAVYGVWERDPFASQSAGGQVFGSAIITLIST